jgi:hypothetical protein
VAFHKKIFIYFLFSPVEPKNVPISSILGLVFLGGVRLSQLGTSATVWPVVPVPDDR